MRAAFAYAGRWLLPACALALLVSNPAIPLGTRVAGPICRIVLDPTNKFTRVGPPRIEASAARVHAAANSATITVNYDANFDANTAAKAAFQAAVNIWQTQVSSSIPIVVNAQLHDLGNPGLLGQAGPAGVLANFSASAQSNTWYPMSIVNRIALFDYNGSTPEIDAEFNSTPAWYFGIDGNTPANQIDFVTVALHELGHGLGFIGAGSVSGATGTVREAGPGPSPPVYPYVYDAFTIDAQGRNLTNTTVYPDNSAALAAALRSGNLFWNGAAGMAASGPQPPRLYAPGSWQAGSSYSHLDESSYPAGNINSLMTPSIGMSESIHSPGPIVLGMFQDMGWGPSACSFVVSANGATAPQAGGSQSVNVTTNDNCGWSAASNASFITITSGASGSGTGMVTYAVDPNGAANQRVGTLTIAGQTFTVTQAGTSPTMSLDRASLQFAATSNGAAFVQQSGGQTVRLLQSGAGTVSWTATPSHPWITVTPNEGTGPATLTIGVQFSGQVASPGAASGSIALSLNGAGNTAGPIAVGLTTIAAGTSAAPFGSFDSPSNNATGVTGSIAVSGWALDDLGVSKVEVWRDPVSGEAEPIFIGTAVLVDGARPDVAGAYPSLPRSSQAGWGYLMLTNFLPSQGNGRFTITAIATDVEGKTTTLGRKTITCTNDTAMKPFGAIDRPGQGEVISGSSFPNFGWVLAREPDYADPPHGGTVTAFIDGVPIGSPAGWSSRPDLTTLFPAQTYPGVSNALAVIGIDTTALANGAHTIFWVVTATNGQQDGIGSRFFLVANSSVHAATRGSLLAPRGSRLVARGSDDQQHSGSDSDADTVDADTVASGFSRKNQSLRLEAPPLLVPEGRTSRLSLVDEVNAAPLEGQPIMGRRSFDLAAPLQSYAAASGQARLPSEELDRIELQLGGAGYTGYLRVNGDLAPLPIGSRLDRATGVFTWGAGIGFLGDYDLVFVRWADGRAVGRQEIRITLGPKQRTRVGPQVVIDKPAPDATVEGSFLVAGWAADLDERAGTGVDTLHVWAYPIHNPADPIFLGATTYGGERPDVGAIFGPQFTPSGYGLIVESLPPGTYDLAVFAWSTVQGRFVPAKVVRITVSRS
jgi:hypothetical protein